jgi:hypothetical protein
MSKDPVKHVCLHSPLPEESDPSQVLSLCSLIVLIIIRGFGKKMYMKGSTAGLSPRNRNAP